MKKKSIKKFAGFTLVELLVVMTIIVVLASVGLVSYRNASQAARNGKRKADIESVRQALVLYKQDNTGDYPQAIGGSPTEAKFTGATDTLTTGNYLSSPAPTDGSSTYNYTLYRAAANQFCVCAYLEGTSKGNASNASCDFTGTPKNYYCAVQP